MRPLAKCHPLSNPCSSRNRSTPSKQRRSVKAGRTSCYPEQYNPKRIQRSCRSLPTQLAARMTTQFQTAKMKVPAHSYTTHRVLVYIMSLSRLHLSPPAVRTSNLEPGEPRTSTSSIAFPRSKAPNEEHDEVAEMAHERLPKDQLVLAQKARSVWFLV